ncbi:MAG: peptide ABC transporter substrate-binding protein [Nitrosomonadales bacterium]|nr:peptide ABC transporter substrate-binding protein [Nitrosomonadales bacterium]|tara:strand:- start:7350 stop:8816 length:1467 start_codon:yes stop_codon:yes gene_type:complete
MNKLTIHLILISLSFFLMTGCSEKNLENIISFGIAQEPQNLDPRFQSDAASERLSSLLYSPLFYYGKDYQLKSKIVNWEKVSPLKYKFRIKQQLPIFHNKTIMDIDDIISTLNNLRNQKKSPFYLELINIKTITKLSNFEFEVILFSKDNNFLTRLSFFILPEDLINSNHNFSLNPIGSGPFMFITKNPNLRIKRLSDNQIIELNKIKDPTVRVLKLINGEIDLLQNDIPLEMINLLKDKEEIVSLTEYGANVSYIGLNLSDRLLKKSKFRKALSLGIDRQSLIKFFLNDQTRIAEQILPPEHWASEKLNSVAYNPDLAKKYIKELDLEEPISITFKTSTDPFRVKIATLIQKQLQIIGIKLIIKSLDWGTYFKDIQAGNFQLYGLTWVGIRNPEIYEKIFKSSFIPPEGLNRGKYKNKETDRLIKRAKESNIWNKVIKKIHTENAFIPLWYEGNFAAFNKNIIGYDVHLDGNWNALKYVRKNYEAID